MQNWSSTPAFLFLLLLLVLSEIPQSAVALNVGVQTTGTGVSLDYLSQECSRNLLNCMANFKKTGGPTFKGNKCDLNEVINVLSVVMEATLVAGRYLHRP